MNIKTRVQDSLADQKSRIFLFMMLAIIVVVSFVAFVSSSRKNQFNEEQRPKTPPTSVPNPTVGMDTIPGGETTTDEYKKLTETYEDRKVKEATKKADSGKPGSALPQLIIADIPDPPKIGGMDDPKAKYQDALQKRLEAQRTLQEDRIKQREQILEQQRADELNRQALKLLGKQAVLLAEDWKVVPQTYVDGKIESYPDSPYLQMLKEARKDTREIIKPTIRYKAGDILFGIILTSINSDEPGPVLVRVLSGPLGNSKIIGSVNPTSVPKKGTDARVSQSLVLDFSLINIPGSKSSIPVKAVAVDPQTARTSMATSVNNHYLLRYGTFFASQFLVGFSQAIEMDTRALVVTQNGTTDVGRRTQLSEGDQARFALGRTAGALSDALNILEKPPTIKVKAGTAVGILLQEDLIIGGDQNDTNRLIGQSLPTNTLSSAPTVDRDAGAAKKSVTDVYGAR